VLNSDRKSYRDDNVQQPGVTGLMPPEDNVLTFRPDYDIVRVQVTERINFTVAGTGTYDYFIPPGGTNYGTFSVGVYGSIWYQWVEEIVANNGTFAVEVFGTHWTDFPEAPAGTNYGTMGFSVYGEAFNTVVDVDAGTGTLTMDASMGNISSYDLYNYILNGNVDIQVYGTYFESIVPTSQGTLYGTISVAAFGTLTDTVISTSAGTINGTYQVDIFGTYLETVVSYSAGTLNGTYSVETFGTALLVTEHGGTWSDFYGTFAVGVFGTYV